MQKLRDIIKLSEEEAEAFEELLESEGYRVLVSKVLPALIKVSEARALSHKISDQQSLLSLGILKAECDGARKLAADIQEFKNASRTSTVMRSRNK